jgi:ketopantoate reductase
MKYVVFGLGAVGSIIGSLIAKSGEKVILIDK